MISRILFGAAAVSSMAAYLGAAVELPAAIPHTLEPLDGSEAPHDLSMAEVSHISLRILTLLTTLVMQMAPRTSKITDDISHEVAPVDAELVQVGSAPTYDPYSHEESLTPVSAGR